MIQDNEKVSKFNGDFERKIFSGTGFEPSSFQPTVSSPADFPSLCYHSQSSVLHSWPQLGCHEPLGVCLLGAKLCTLIELTQSDQMLNRYMSQFR